MKIKKLLAILLLFVMVLTTACSGDPAVLLPFIDGNNTKVDYEGYKFQYFWEGGSTYDETKSILGYDKNTQQGEAMLKRIADIKDEINVEFAPPEVMVPLLLSLSKKVQPASKKSPPSEPAH